VVFGTAQEHLILVYLWTAEARDAAIKDLDNAVIEGTSILQLRTATDEDLQRALEMQKNK
jgi:hypothetical protein